MLRLLLSANWIFCILPVGKIIGKQSASLMGKLPKRKEYTMKHSFLKY